MKKILFLAVMITCILSLFSSKAMADDTPVQVVGKIRFQPLAGAITVHPSVLIKKIKDEAKEDKNIEITELRLYIKNGKLLAVEPMNRESAGKKWEFLRDLSGEKIREVIGVGIKQESPVCTYWYSLWGWEKVCQ